MERIQRIEEGKEKRNGMRSKLVVKKNFRNVRRLFNEDFNGCTDEKLLSHIVK